MKLIALLIICIPFVGCEGYKAAQINKPLVGSITQVPLVPHNRKVDLFFNTEKPTNAYYKAKIVEVTALPTATADEMLNAIKKQAALEGIDGLIIDNLSQQTSTVQSVERVQVFNSLPITNYNYKVLSGIGIIYKKNITYIDTILKTQIVKWWATDSSTPKEFEINFDLQGNNTSINNDFIYAFLINEVQPYDVFENSYPPNNNWEYKADLLNNIIAKQTDKGIKYSYQVMYEYLNLSHPYFAYIKIINNENAKAAKYKLLLHYNTNGKLIEKTLTQKGITLWTETIAYDANGKLQKCERWKTANNQQKTIYTIENVYYNLADLPQVEN
jgi:hypothetical protein